MEGKQFSKWLSINIDHFMSYIGEKSCEQQDHFSKINIISVKDMFHKNILNQFSS
jgi:hypothetical protein